MLRVKGSLHPCTIWPHLRQNRQWPPMQMLLWQKFFGIMSKHIHSRMRRQSSALVTATDKTSGIGVLFDVDHEGIVRKYPFQRGSTLKFLKTSRTFFVLILGQRHGVIISGQPIKKGSTCYFFILKCGGKFIFFNIFCCLFWRRASVLFKRMRRKSSRRSGIKNEIHAFKTSHAYDQESRENILLLLACQARSSKQNVLVLTGWKVGFLKFYSDGLDENRVFWPENWIQH